MTEKEFTPSKHGVYFLELELENVRCFGEKVKIDLRDPKDPQKPARWTVLVGENGVGKTTVLRSLVSVAPFPRLSNGGGVNAKSYIPGDWKFTHLWDSARNERDAHCRPLLGLFPNLTSDQIGDSQTFDFTLFPRSSGDDISTLEFTELPIGFDHATFPVIGYGASRHMSTAGISENPNEKTNLSLFQDDVPLINAEELWLQTDYGNKSAAPITNASLSDKVHLIFTKLLPDVSGLQAVRGVGLGWNVEVETPYGWVKMKNLSLGYRTMTSWVVDFAYKLFLLYPNSINPLEEPAICLVDEIDLHLHPKWQRKIMDFLTHTFPNTQFIVTAHSPLMVQASAEANIVLLKREGDHVVVENDPIVVKNWSVDQILASVFGVSPRLEATEMAMAKRRGLASQSSLTAEEQAELFQLDRQLEGYSVYETADQREAVSLLDTFTRIIKASKKANPDDQHP
ncbi:MAG: hypothetical protein RLZZ519_2065 [Bacteroidota bacterium]|jgi:hypothetical protein